MYSHYCIGGAELQQVVVNGTSATVEHLQADTLYTFYLLAFNGLGSSEKSERVNLSTASFDDPRMYPHSQFLLYGLIINFFMKLQPSATCKWWIIY